MDIATHILVSWLLAQTVAFAWRLASMRRGQDPARVAETYARHSGWAAVFGLSAMGPDLDGVISWARHVDGLWWAQHRGVTHTVWGAALTGFGVACALHLLARRWPRWFAAFTWRPSFLLAGALGGVSGILLDIPTLGGIPALWPFDGGRLILPPFHWLVIWLFPVSLALILWRLSGRLRTERFVALGAVVVVVLLVMGGARIMAMPEAPEGGSVHARAAVDEWIILRPLDGDPAKGWNTTLLRAGHPVVAFDVQASHEPVTFAGRAWDQAEVTATVGGTNAYKGFMMNAVSPVVLQWSVEPAPAADGAAVLEVRLVDPAAHMDAREGARWTPADPFEAWGVLRFQVSDDGTPHVVQQGW